MISGWRDQERAPAALYRLQGTIIFLFRVQVETIAAATCDRYWLMRWVFILGQIIQSNWPSCGLTRSGASFGFLHAAAWKAARKKKSRPLRLRRQASLVPRSASPAPGSSA